MSTIYTANNVPFAQLFAPDVIGDGPVASSLTDNGVPLRFAALKYGQKRADIGIQQDGVDVTNLWAASGTAAYVSADGGLPSLVEDITQGQTPPVPASIVVTIRRDGTTTCAPSGSPAIHGQWSTAPTATVGDLYEVEILATVSNGKGSFTCATMGTFAVISTERVCTIAVTNLKGSGIEEALRTVQFRFRRTGGAVMVTRSINLRAYAQVINEG